MKRILLLFFLTFPFLSSWAIADWKPIADGLYADLANQKTPADSVRVLYNIFDLVPRAQQGMWHASFMTRLNGQECPRCSSMCYAC